MRDVFDVGDIRASIDHVERRRGNPGFSIDSIKDSLPDLADPDVSMPDVDLSIEGLSLNGAHPSTLPEPNDVEMIDHKPQALVKREARVPDASLPDTPRRSVVSHLMSPTRLGAELATSDGALVPYEGPRQEAKVEIKTEIESSPKLRRRKRAEADSQANSERSLGSNASQLDATRDASTTQIHMPIPSPSWIARNHNLPYVLSTYLQLLFNTTMLSLAAYTVVHGCRSFWRDVDTKMDQYRAETLVDISQCNLEYIENRCGPNLRAPALAELCNRLEKCMARDPDAIRRLPIGAELLGEIINGFIDTFSLRSLFVILVAFLGIVFVFNVTFGFLRAKYYYRRKSAPVNSHTQLHAQVDPQLFAQHAPQLHAQGPQFYSQLHPIYQDTAESRGLGYSM